MKEPSKLDNTCYSYRKNKSDIPVDRHVTNRHQQTSAGARTGDPLRRVSTTWNSCSVSWIKWNAVATGARTTLKSTGAGWTALTPGRPLRPLTAHWNRHSPLESLAVRRRGRRLVNVTSNVIHYSMSNHSVCFHKDLISGFWVIQLTDKQDTGENTTSYVAVITDSRWFHLLRSWWHCQNIDRRRHGKLDMQTACI